MYKFIKHDIPQCEQLNLPEGRRYKTPNGDIYPSVTTVLSTNGNPIIAEWRAKVGDEVADRITNAAAERGTLVHAWCEAYLKTEPIIVPRMQEEAAEMFGYMVPELQKIQEVHALEQRLWSDKLRVAGTVDCVARINGRLYIVDFKTSTRYKSRNDIPNYFMQCAAYALAWYERTGMVISQMRILITTGEFGMLVYDEPVLKWIPQFEDLRLKFDSSL